MEWIHKYTAAEMHERQQLIWTNLSINGLLAMTAQQNLITQKKHSLRRTLFHIDCVAL